jgi:hypothetical protein
MQEGIENPANSGSSFRVNRSLGPRKEEPASGRDESSRKRRRRTGHLGTTRRTIRRGVET